MSEELKQEEGAKKPKTWDEAFNELQSFIIKSRKEEAEKAQQKEEKPSWQ